MRPRDARLLRSVRAGGRSLCAGDGHAPLARNVAAHAPGSLVARPPPPLRADSVARAHAKSTEHAGCGTADLVAAREQGSNSSCARSPRPTRVPSDSADRSLRGSGGAADGPGTRDAAQSLSICLRDSDEVGGRRPNEPPVGGRERRHFRSWGGSPLTFMFGIVRATFIMISFDMFSLYITFTL